MITGTREAKKELPVVVPQPETPLVPVVEVPRAIRVVVDLLVDEDIWEEKKAEGCTDKYLVGEVKKTLRIEANGPWYDYDIQEIMLMEKGGNRGQSES
jgi:hypothetical protein